MAVFTLEIEDFHVQVCLPRPIVMSEIGDHSEQLQHPSLFEFDFHKKHFQVKEEAQRKESNNAIVEDLLIYSVDGNKVGKIHGKRETDMSGERFTAFSAVNLTQDRQTGISKEQGIVSEAIIQATMQVFDTWRSSLHLNPATGVPMYEKIAHDPRVTVHQEQEEGGVRQIVQRKPHE